jgi:hypothetical protein
MRLKVDALSILCKTRGLYALMSWQSDGILQPYECDDIVGQPCGPSLHPGSDAANEGNLGCRDEQYRSDRAWMHCYWVSRTVRISPMCPHSIWSGRCFGEVSLCGLLLAKMMELEDCSWAHYHFRLYYNQTNIYKLISTCMMEWRALRPRLTGFPIENA